MFPDASLYTASNHPSWSPRAVCSAAISRTRSRAISLFAASFILTLPVADGWCTRFLPGLPSASHRKHIPISHFLQHVCCKRRAISAAAIQDHLRRFIRKCLDNITLDHAATHVSRAVRVVCFPFVIFSYIDKLCAVVHPLHGVADADLANTRPGVACNCQKLFRMVHLRV